MKVLIGIPLTWDYVSKDFMWSLLEMQKYAKGKYDLSFIKSKIYLIDQARENLADRFMKSNVDYLLCLDADQTYPEDTPERLMKHIDSGKLVVGGLTKQRVQETWMAYDFGEDFKQSDKKIEQGTGLQKVDAMGFGGIMLSRKVFDILEKPYFLAVTAQRGGWLGEDIYFYRKCKQKNIGVWCDTDLKLGHIKTVTI